MPSAVWIWQVDIMKLVAVLIHQHPVRTVEWEPESENLAVCCGTSRVYMWSPAGASVVHVPLEHFQASGVKWSLAGSGFLLTDSDSFCVGYLTNDGE